MTTKKVQAIKDERGFSTIELMVVLGIIAVLAGITIPVFNSMRPAMRLNGAVSQMQGDLMWARMQAISQNNDFRIVYVNDHQYRIWDDDDSDKAGSETEVTYIKDLQTSYSDVTYSSSNANNLIFTPRGTASGWTTLTIKNPNPNYPDQSPDQFNSKTITISSSGRIKAD